MTLALRRTVFADGERRSDDYEVRHNGRTVGRILRLGACLSNRKSPSRAVNQINVIRTNNSAHMKQPSTSVVKSDTPIVTRTGYMVLPDLNIFSYPLPSAMEFETAGRRQWGSLLSKRSPRGVDC
jgi:hypothetical protein